MYQLHKCTINSLCSDKNITSKIRSASLWPDTADESSIWLRTSTCSDRWKVFRVTRQTRTYSWLVWCMCWRHSHIYLITEHPECLRAVGPRLRRRCESGDDSWDTGRRSCSAPGREPARTPNMPSGNFSVTFNRLRHSPDFTCCSDYRYVDFPEHLGSSASIQQGDVLRRRHDDRTWKHRHMIQLD